MNKKNVGYNKTFIKNIFLFTVLIQTTEASKSGHSERFIEYIYTQSLDMLLFHFAMSDVCHDVLE